MPDRYPIPAGVARTEFSEKNSIFIGTAGPASSVDEAEHFIRLVATEFKDASHNVWAYLIGFGPTATLACHNDGEPGGTAGPPALAVLQGCGLGDIAVVVTRYFGGIKLGTGGLARAYGRAAREAVAALPRSERVARVTLSVEIDYHFHDGLRRALPTYEIIVQGVDYGPTVRFDLSLPVDRADEFALFAQEMTSSRAIIRR